MKRAHLLALFVLSLTSGSFAQSKPGSADKLVGTWRLIELTDFDSATSTWIYPFGKNARGFFTYTKSGIVNLNISTDTPLKMSEDSAKNYTINLLNWVDHYAVGYFGTYTVDAVNSVVTHHVKGGSLPWYNETDQPRPFILKGDTLILGDHKTWKRVLVRAD
jgi:hypothetical protein